MTSFKGLQGISKRVLPFNSFPRNKCDQQHEREGREFKKYKLSLQRRKLREYQIYSSLAILINTFYINVRTYQEKRRRQLIKKNDGHGRTEEDKTGRSRRRWIDNNRKDMSKYELTADMTENRQYWKMMVKTGPQRSGDGLQRWER